MSSLDPEQTDNLGLEDERVRDLLQSLAYDAEMARYFLHTITDERTIEILRSMSDAERARFIASQFIAAWEHGSAIRPGTLSLDKQNYWIENAKRLVFLDNGNRDPEKLFTEAYEIIKPYLHFSEREDDTSILSAVSTVSDIILEATSTTVKTGVVGIQVVGDKTLEATKAIFTVAQDKTVDAGEKIVDYAKEKAGEAFEAILGRFENVAYLTIAVGLVGTTVLYLRR